MTLVHGADTTLVEVDPRVDPRWAALVAGPGGSVFTSPAWLRVISATYADFVPEGIVVCDPGGRPVSGAVTVTVDDALGRRRLGLPFSDFADPVVGDRSHLPALLGHFLDDRVPLRMRALRTDLSSIDERLVESGAAAWHEISVTADEDELWSRLGGSSRRNVRKARDGGVEIAVHDDIAAMRRFYDLHVGVRVGKYGLLPQPWEFFESIHREFAAVDGVRVVMARHDDRDIAGIVVLLWDGVAYYKFNASAADQLSLRPNDLLMWSTMLLAREEGCRSLDLGVSDLDQEGLVRYKRKFATLEDRVTTWSTPADPSEAARLLRGTFTDLTSLLTDPTLPDHVAPEAGRLLYRYFA